MILLQTHLVPEGVPRQRLSDYACGLFEALPSRKSVKKAIERGAVLVDGMPGETGIWVTSGQRIDLIDLPNGDQKVFPLAIGVVYEDPHLAVVHKPAGFPVSGNRYKTIEHALPYNLKPSSAPDRLYTPRPVHRLDSLTSGLLLVAKTSRAQIGLSAQFEARKVDKRYQAIVIGDLPESGTIELPIDGKPALTLFRRLAQAPSLECEMLSLVELIPETGRTHQLRIHLSQLGFPIQGDRLYAGEVRLLKGKGLFLCATGLACTHPVTGERLQFSLSPPSKFFLLMERSQRRWEKYFRSQAD